MCKNMQCKERNCDLQTTNLASTIVLQQALFSAIPNLYSLVFLHSYTCKDLHKIWFDMKQYV